MILYLRDWSSYPTARPDWDTPNKSFLKVARLLQSMGVANFAFLLALHDQTLKGVDPHDPNLTLETKGRIAIECKINYWYHLREVVRAPGESGEDARAFRASRGNIAVYWLLLNHITTFFIGPRQLTGKSFTINVMVDWLLNIGCKDTKINLLTKNDNLRASNLEDLKHLDAELPKYLQQRTSKDLNNTAELTVNALGNKFTGHVPSASPKTAHNLGRGLTSSIFAVDEPPFQPNIGISLPVALAAAAAARRAAKRAGAPYFTVLTTTAGKKDDRDGRFIYNLKQECAKWSESLLDAENQEDLEKIIRANSRGDVVRVNCTFSHLQLGFTDEDLDTAIRDTMSSNIDDINRDFFNVWTSGSQKSILSVAIATTINGSKKEPLYNKIYKEESYIVRWYIPEEEIETYMETRPIILSLDSSDGVGNDALALTIRCAYTGAIIAAGDYNCTNLISFSKWLFKEWFIKYPKLTGIIERRSSAASIIDYLWLFMLKEGINPFKRLFNRVINDYQEKAYKDAYAEVTSHKFGMSSIADRNLLNKYKKFFGFATSGSGVTSREALYSDTFLEAAKNTGHLVNDDELASQILGLIVKNGRVDHSTGGHDDLVISWLLSYWLMSLGRNLSYYGIDSSEILAGRIDIDNEELTPSERYDLRLQNSYRARLKDLLKDYVETKDTAIQTRLRRSIADTGNRIILRDGEDFSVDALEQMLDERDEVNRMNNNQYQHSARVNTARSHHRGLM